MLMLGYLGRQIGHPWPAPSQHQQLLSSMSIPTAILHSYLTSVSAQDWDAMLSLFTDDCELTAKPESLGFPVQVRSQLLGALKGSVGNWFAPGALKFTVNQVYETKPGNTIIAHAHSDGTSKLGTPWHNEYMFTVEVEGGKIRRITEFIDSGFLKSFIEAETKASKA
ncbi:hypothetical protein CPB85DRAFT_1566985 [Mucidula mucida]|nr:hypothetical protein CPB85DRAFT_1566985 [Mucidula mucida]